MDTVGNYVLFEKNNYRIRQIIVSASLLTLILFLIMPLSEFFTQAAKKTMVCSIVPIEIYKPKRERKLKKAEKVKKVARSSPKFANVKQKLTPLELKVELPIGSSIYKDMDFDFEFSSSFDASDLVFDLDQVDAPPEAILKIPPAYPISARRLGKEGKVDLLFVVNDQGGVEDVIVVDSEPGDIFVASAVKTIKKWKFKPARKDNSPVSVRVEIPLTFRLKR